MTQDSDQYMLLLAQFERLKAEKDRISSALEHALERESRDSRMIAQLQAERNSLRDRLAKYELQPVERTDDLAQSICIRSFRLQRENEHLEVKQSFPAPFKVPQVLPDSSARIQVAQPGLFEHFVVLGPSNAEAEPGVLFCFPDQKRCGRNSPLLAVLPDFCFPEGLHVRQVSFNDSASDLHQILYGQNLHVRSANWFVFTLKATEEWLEVNADWDRPNKDREILYCVCLQVNDLLENVVAPKILCLISYHACFELHFEVLTKILIIQRLRRLEFMTNPEPDALSRMQAENLGAEEMMFLVNYQQAPVPMPRVPVSIELNSVDHVRQTYPADLWRLDAEWVCPALFSVLRFQDFYLLTMALMLEKSLVFVSSNLGLVTSCVLAMTAVIRPFKWPHLFSPILPHSLREVLEAPVPLLVGLQSSPPKRKQYGQLIWVMLDEPNINKRVQAKDIREVKEPYADNLKQWLSVAYKHFASDKPVFLPTAPQRNAASEIVKQTRAYWEGLLSLLPERPMTCPGGNFLDVEGISNRLLSSTPAADQRFLKPFLQSQLFVNHVEERYASSNR